MDTPQDTGTVVGEARQRTCQVCQAEFAVEPEDLAFYHKVSPQFAGTTYEISVPTRCPQCRQQRRLTWRGEKKFYQRACNKCGSSLITIFHPDSKHQVYCRDCWWGDGWSAESFGREIDFSRPFFEQFQELLHATPLLFSWNISGENSEYNNNVSYLKDCYLLSSSNRSEACYYGYYINDCKDCIDCNSVKKSELLYECIECVGGYNLKYCQNSVNCADSWFLQNCLGCKHCFGCTNLKQKEYCWFNEQLSKEEYEQKLAEFKSGSLTATRAMNEQTRHQHLKHPYKYMVGEQNEDVSGNVVHQSKNAHACFDCIQVEDCKYCHQMQESKSCYDVMTWGRPAELLYECMGVGSNAYLNRFSAISQDSKDALYCYMCMFSTSLFGCVGVKRGEYLILNKQYSKEEYEELVPKLIEHMRQTGEWGEFFPSSLSPFAYNEALSNDWMPLTKDEAVAKGFRWRDPDPKEYQPQSYQVSDNIAQVDEELTNQLLACRECRQNYKIIPHELAFYKTNVLPVPDLCPVCRHKARMSKRNPRQLWHRSCMNESCRNEFETTYAPDRPEIAYCESCYQAEVI